MTAQDILDEIDRLTANRAYNEALALSVKHAPSFSPPWPLMLRSARVYELIQEWQSALGLYQNVHQSIQAAGEKSDVSIVIAICRCLVKTDQFADAARLLQELETFAPGLPEVQLHLATCARNMGDIAAATQLVERTLEKAPDWMPATYEKAAILAASGQPDEAIRLLETNIRRPEIHGDSIDLWLEILAEQKRNRYAQDTLEELMRDYPDTLEFAYGFAVLANRAGESSLARPAFEKCLELSPNNFRVAYEYGVMERIDGDLAKSQELIAKALSLKPDNPAALRTYASDLKYAYGDENFQRLNSVAARLTDFSNGEQVHLHYALAKAFDDVKEHQTAFRHYAVAGEKKRREEVYDEQGAIRLGKLIPQVVTRENLDKTGQTGFDSQVPVFVLGMPRSGTSLLEQVLSAHPDIFGAGELKYMVGVLENIKVAEMRLRMGEDDPVFPYDDVASWDARGAKYVEKLEKLAGAPYKRIVDKMPGNFNFVGLIHSILPNARIIHSRRHPVETCLSCYRINFAEGHQWTYNLRELGRYYRRYWDLMKHWRSEFPGVMYEVRYEDNVADLEVQARSLIDHLGLDWNERCLEFHKVDRPVKTASVTQVRKPIYKSSTNRWRQYESYLGPLIDELGDVIEEYESEIGHLIEK